eukprot:3212310-Alexandrium_andersonii.AAC.1
MLTPVNYIHSAQHRKTWLLGCAIHCVGSANGAENSLARCHEVVLWTKSREVCSAAGSDLNSLRVR